MFELKDGITLFYNERSPCAKKVKYVLNLKNIKYDIIHIDLFTRQNHTIDYYDINPLGKVPALVIQNVPSIPNCKLYESNAIIEFIDSVYPQNKLYPDKLIDRIKIYEWCTFESEMAESFWKLVYQFINGPRERMWFSYNNHNDYLDNRYKHSNEKLYNKLSGTFNGTLLSKKNIKKHYDVLYRCLYDVEYALIDNKYLIGDDITMADLTVYFRLVMFPLLNINIYNMHQFSHTYNWLKDMTYHVGGFSNYFMMYYASYIPWSIIEYIGNWRSGLDFHRITPKVLERHETIEYIGRNIFYYKTNNYELYTLKMLCMLMDKNILFIPSDDDVFKLTGDRIIKGIANVIEYIADMNDLIPKGALDKCKMKMMIGYIKTCDNYKNYNDVNLSYIENILMNSTYLVNDKITIADIYMYNYYRHNEDIFKGYANIDKWLIDVNLFLTRLLH